MQRLRAVVVLGLVSSATLVSMPAQDWPRNDARWTIDIFKKTAAEQTDDLYWLALTSPSATVTVGVRITQTDSSALALEEAGIQIRYLAHGTPVSDWLNAPFTFTLSMDNPGLDALADGLHDLSLEVQGNKRADFKPRPVFLKLVRGRDASPLVPLMGRDCMYCDYGFDWGPAVVYVDPGPLLPKRRGRPVDPTVKPWTAPPDEADLWQEELAPHTNLFFGLQMWWEDATTGRPYVRVLLPKWDEDHRGLRVLWKQERFPFIDGPRGISWTSAYTTGQVAADGTLIYTEAGGPLRALAPDGTIRTITGWRVKQDALPIWLGEPVAVVRRNMEFVGQFVEGRYANGDGFRTPLDVAIDPKNPKVYYVVGYEDHCVWKVDETNALGKVDETNTLARVSVLAGDPKHVAGYANGQGHAARFNGPASIVFDPVADVMYVADQDNDAIRRVTRTGAVTTLFGGPGMIANLQSAGLNAFDRAVTRARPRYKITAAEAAGGARPEIFMPQTVRVDSHGQILELSLGFGAIRRLNPATGEATHLVNVDQRFENSSRGWAWLDVDRLGKSGPLDGIYYGVFQGSTCEGASGTRTNEAYCWMPSTGGPARFVFGPDWDPYPDAWGPVSRTDPPHYFWLAAVDPRGGVYLAGGGEHGVTRLRARKSTDVAVSQDLEYMAGKLLWQYGVNSSGPTHALRFGWEAHNYLGLPDAWDYTGANDATLASVFELPDTLDGTTRRRILNFLKLNAQNGGPLMPRRQ